MRLPFKRSGLRWYLLVFALLAGKTTSTSILCGLLPLLLGILIHLWAKGCLHQNQQVTTAGPYRFVRHPFYLGNLLIDAAIVIMSGWNILMCVFPIWWLTVYLPVMRHEESILTGLFGQAYGNYSCSVPMFLPIRFPLPATPGFSWRNANLLRTEVPRAFRFLSYPFLFMIAHEIRNQALLPYAHLFPTPVLTLSLLLILALNGLAWRVRRVSKGNEIPDAQWLSARPVFLLFVAIFVLSGSLIPIMETERDAIIWPLGCMFMGLSILLRVYRSHEGLFALMLLMIGACTLWEIPWLSLAAALVWLPTWLYERLAPDLPRSPNGVIPFVSVRLSRLGFFALSLLCVLSAVAKEIG